jgi:hypothetical protein
MKHSRKMGKTHRPVTEISISQPWMHSQFSTKSVYELEKPKEKPQQNINSFLKTFILETRKRIFII